MKKITFLVVSTLLMLAAPVAAQSYYSEDSATLTRAGFGRALAVLDGDVFVGEGGNPVGAGTVFIYRKDAAGEWTEQARLNGSDQESGDGFGSRIAADGNTMLVGSAGGVYVFEKNGSDWTETGRIVVSGIDQAQMGRATLALAGGVAIVGAPWDSEGAGAIYVLGQGADGSFSEVAKLTGSGGSSGHSFGSAVAVLGDRALVGAPGADDRTGTVYSFVMGSDGAWREETRITPNGLAPRDGFGAFVRLSGEGALVGAPGLGGTGAMFAFTHTEEDGFGLHSRLLPFDGGQRASFGAAAVGGGQELWVGAPGDRRSPGTAYLFSWDAQTSDWGSTRKMVLPERGGGDAFGGALAADGNVVAVGVGGDDSGEGSVVIYELTAEGAWEASPKILSNTTMYERIAGDQVSCVEGSAALWGCGEVDLMAFVPVQEIGGARGINVNDIWGWEDPETGHEYALVGRQDGTGFVDVTNAGNPIYIGNLDKTEGSRVSVWRDIKVYADHAFIVSDGAGAHGMQVLDLTRLREFSGEPIEFTEDAHYDEIFSAHNIVINEETGFAYTVGNSGGGETCGGGSHMIDIRDPKNPIFAGCFAHQATGRRGTGYTHDGQCVVYHGPDEDYRGKEVCFGANETALSIADVTDKSSPVEIAQASYPNVGYTHQGWLSEDQAYFYINDELDELANEFEGTRTLIWDIADLDDPQLVREHFGTTRASDHNLYIRDNLMYQSNYQSGLRILDISDPANPVEVGFFDTVPYGDNDPGMGGSWSNYPFFRSGAVIVTSGREGLFIVKRKVTIS